MNLFDNPFYILGASPADNKQRLCELAEEKSLLLDADAIAKAHNILMNPQKRLIAEISWFPGASKEDQSFIVECCDKLKRGFGKCDLKHLRLGELAFLNCKWFELDCSTIKDPKTAQESILELSSLFERIDLKIAIKQINQGRIESGFPVVTDMSRVEEELRNIREEIKLVIRTKLATYSREEYVEILTALAEKYAASDDTYHGHAVISDLLADYKLNYAEEIEDQKRRILETVSNIKKSASSMRLVGAISDLSDKVITWDKLVQPIQLAARGEGKREEDSDEVAYAIRDLAIDLHNQHNQTAQALRLTMLLKEQFSELPDFLERINEDAITLQRINQEREQSERDDTELLIRNRQDMRYSVSIHSEQVKIPPLCTCCLQPTTRTEKVSASATQQHIGSKTTRTISLDMPICDDCVGHKTRTKTFAVLLLMLSLLFAAIGMMVLSNTRYASSELAYLPVLIAALAFLIFGFLLRLPILGGEHSARQKSVWMGGSI